MCGKHVHPGPQDGDAKAFRVAVPLEMGDPSEVSAAHRTRARKRREDRLAVEECAFQAIQKEMTGGPRPGLG